MKKIWEGVSREEEIGTEVWRRWGRARVQKLGRGWERGGTW